VWPTGRPRKVCFALMERFEPQEQQRVTSIDLLEECHLSIYRIRKKCKEMKKRSRLSQPTIVSNSNLTNYVEQKREIPHKASFQETNSSLKKSPITNQNSFSRSDSVESNSGNEDSSSVTRAQPKAQSINKNSPLKRPEGLMGFSSLEDQKNDKTATDIYEAFKRELRHWWNANPTKRTDEDIRGDLADDLTERFLCQRLDPLPASRVVTNVRKTMSQVIEDFASQGTLPPEIITPEEEKIQAPVTKFAKEKQERELKAIAEEKERRERQQRENQESQVKRAEQEKQRIKEQYESYMKLKNQTKTVEKGEEKQEQELENHLDDIRSLISSIKGTAAGPGGGK
jgi:hypothetical protein